VKSLAPLASLLGLTLIGAACQTGPQPVPEARAEERLLPDPVDVPEPPDPDIPILNQWGGEVPLSVPTGTVTQEGLEDLR
jgi:hypothetical protein